MHELDPDDCARIAVALRLRATIIGNLEPADEIRHGYLAEVILERGLFLGEEKTPAVVTHDEGHENHEAAGLDLKTNAIVQGAGCRCHGHG